MNVKRLPSMDASCPPAVGYLYLTVFAVGQGGWIGQTDNTSSPGPWTRREPAQDTQGSAQGTSGSGQGTAHEGVGLSSPWHPRFSCAMSPHHERVCGDVSRSEVRSSLSLSLSLSLSHSRCGCRISIAHPGCQLVDEKAAWCIRRPDFFAEVTTRPNCQLNKPSIFSEMDG